MAQSRPLSLLVLRPIVRYRNSTQWNGLSFLPQHFSIQTAAVQWEVSLPRPWDEAPQRASSPNWLPPPASDWHHCTARDIKKDNNSCFFFHILYQPDRHTTVSKLHDKANYLSLQPNWNQIWVQFKIFGRSLTLIDVLCDSLVIKVKKSHIK